MFLKKIMDKKLPFKEYTVLNNNLVQSLGCSDAYRAYVLALTTDKKTLETDTTIEQLATFVGESSSNYIKGSRNKSFNDKLKATNEVTIIPFKANGRDRNKYVFNQPPSGGYIRISRKFYDDWNHLSEKALLGFILKLFSVAEPHSLFVIKNMRKLEKLIHMGHATIRKYMKQLELLGLLQPIENGWELKIEGLIIDQPGQKAIRELINLLDRLYASHEDRKELMPAYLKEYEYYRNRNFEGVENLGNLLVTLSCGMTRYPKKEKKQAPSDIIIL